MQQLSFMRSRKKPFVSKLVDRSGMGGSIGSRSIRSAHDVHQKERISIDIDVLSDALNFLCWDAVDFDPSSHPSHYTNTEHKSHIRTSAWHYWYFFRRYSKHAGLIFDESRLNDGCVRREN